MNRKNKVVESVHEHEIQVIGRHLQVTDAMKSYAIEKFNKIDKYSCRVVNSVITMDIQREDKRVDIIAHVNNVRVKVGATTNDMYASIDKASDRMQAKIRKYTEFLHNHHTLGLADLEMNVKVVNRPEDDLNEINLDIEAQNQQEINESLRPHEVVTKEIKPLKTLTQQEAIIKMELSQDRFMIYRSEEDQKLKVIYRRNDGNYGIIEPETAQKPAT